MGAMQHIRGDAKNWRHGYKTAGRYSSEYAIWSNMRARCTNPNSINFDRYGGRGITVCEAWSADFVNFLNDMGNRPSPDHSLDRIDNNGNYEPKNCQWATRQEQCRNRSTSRFIQVGNDSRTMAEWSEITGLRVGTIHARIKQGWSESDAVTRPLRGAVSKDGKTFSDATIHKSFPF